MSVDECIVLFKFILLRMSVKLKTTKYIDSVYICCFNHPKKVVKNDLKNDVTMREHTTL